MRIERLSKEQIEDYAAEPKLNYYARSIQAMAQEILENRKAEPPPIVFDAGKPRLKRDWVGRRVITQAVLKNGLMEFPIGTVMEVTYSHGGLNLKSLPCPHCGVSIFIRKVSELQVRLLADE